MAFNESPYVSTEGFISLEYNKFDWNRAFFGVFNQLYRLISNADKTRIEHPGLMLNLFLGKWSNVGQLYHALVGIFAPAMAATPVAIPAAIMTSWSFFFTGEFGLSLKDYLKNTPNSEKLDEFSKSVKFKNPLLYIF